MESFQKLRRMDSLHYSVQLQKVQSFKYVSDTKGLYPLHENCKRLTYYWPVRMKVKMFFLEINYAFQLGRFMHVK